VAVDRRGVALTKSLLVMYGITLNRLCIRAVASGGTIGIDCQYVFLSINQRIDKSALSFCPVTVISPSSVH
jgi:hypothetical protein